MQSLSTDKWYRAILQRHSRRQFNGRKLPKELINGLSQFSDYIGAQIPGARAVVVTENPEKVFKGAVGSYGKVKGAPAYVAFIGDMSDPHIYEKVGYLGEYFILEATAQDIGTCWIGGFFKPDVVQEQIQVTDKEQVLAVSPLGFVNKEPSLEEKLLSGLAKSHKRKPLDSLILTHAQEPLAGWVSSGLEAARLAPSAVNRQPWRFSIEDNSVKILIDDNRNTFHIPKRLDCGIAMAHLEIAAKHYGVQGQWEYLENPEVARFTAV
ncbi:nitroreductase family protein [Desulfitobacterium sp. AusDCA]|uniref:nitroreductase family protein n=1 Tax=Desulfitobacterium sp. AusDCA TaxID=3240383 RepID=UPI003DA72164